ncbi:MAG: RNA-binding protein [Candidatus Aenigmarchaeota archaeon]|nr:RNA-binding protein [Candidatus Aenigmarchaeota archaeon]
MNELQTEIKRTLVVPGDLLGEGRAGHGAYEEDGRVYSAHIGFSEERAGVFVVVPLGGIYNPQRGDGVIGKIEDIIFSKWIVDINSPYEAVLPVSEATSEYIDMAKTDLTHFFNYGDLIFAEISAVTKTKNVQLSMMNRKCRKLKGGRVIRVTPSKVPRIIGKAGSMVEMIKKLTDTQIVVGQNGIVWVKGANDDIAAEAVLTIEKRSHISGLTDYINSMVQQRMGEKAQEPRV